MKKFYLRRIVVNHGFANTQVHKALASIGHTQHNTTWEAFDLAPNFM